MSSFPGSSDRRTPRPLPSQPLGATGPSADPWPSAAEARAALATAEALVAQLRDVLRRAVAAEAEAAAVRAEASTPLTLREAGRIAHVHPRTVGSWVRSGLLKALRTDRGYRVVRSDLAAFLASAPRRARSTRSKVRPKGADPRQLDLLGWAQTDDEATARGSDHAGER